MKAILTVLIAFSALTNSFAAEKPNLDDLDVLEKIIEGAVEQLDKRKKSDGSNLYYQPRKIRPYTGWKVAFCDNGQVASLTHYKKGKLDGLSTSWHENGQKFSEDNYKDGLGDGLSTRWDQNGQKYMEENYKDGKKEGLATFWYYNGQKGLEWNFSEGKCIDANAWKQNGEKCPETNLKDGCGIIVLYKQDGNEDKRLTIKDGEILSDLSAEKKTDISELKVQGILLNNELKLATIGPIERLIICDEGVTPKKYHEFSNLPIGWEKTIEFKNSFRCYSSSLENLRFALGDGPERKADGTGAGSFSWSK